MQWKETYVENVTFSTLYIFSLPNYGYIISTVPDYKQYYWLYFHLSWLKIGDRWRQRTSKQKNKIEFKPRYLHFKWGDFIPWRTHISCIVLHSESRRSRYGLYSYITWKCMKLICSQFGTQVQKLHYHKFQYGSLDGARKQPRDNLRPSLSSAPDAWFD